MSERRSDSWVSVLMSVLVHGAIFVLLGWGWWAFRRPAPAAQQLAIEAQVVDSATLARLTSARPPVPQPVVPQPEAAAAPPPPEPEQERKAELERKAEQGRQAEQERVAQQKAEQQKAERDRAELAERERRASEAKAKTKAKLEAQARAEAERKARAAAEREQAARRQAEAERARRESELRAQMAAEERVNAARGSAQQAEYKALIEARINRAWIRPATARSGINCEVRVTQVPGGEVVGVQLTRCNGDAAVRESIEAAVYRASPLPQPPNPDLFDRNLLVTFAPND